jgi:hypothetical protein
MSAILASVFAASFTGPAWAQVQAFQDVTDSVGLSPTKHVVGNNNIAWGDYDGDGWVDLYCSNRDVNKDAYLFKNNGGTFTQQGFDGFDWYGIFGDYDNDGDLDLFSYWDGANFARNEGASGFVADGSVVPEISEFSVGACWGDLDGDTLLDIYSGGYENWDMNTTYDDSVLMNQSASSFNVDRSIAGRRARGITMADFDEDNDLDVYVSNYRLQPNQLWLNDGAGNLVERANEYDVDGIRDATGYYGHTIGSAWGDLDNDGHIDLFVGNFAHPTTGQDRPQFLKNLGPDGEYRFEDKSATANLEYQESYASPALGDFDNDGYLDLYFTIVYAGGSDHNVLYRNTGNWGFSDVTSQADLGISIQGNYQAAWADYDRDGDLDLFTGGRLYENPLDNGNHWLQVHIEGDGQRVDAQGIGTQVRIPWNGMTLLRQVEGATGQGNQNDPTLHFGLGSESGPVTLQVSWLNGYKQLVETGVDQRITVSGPPSADGDEDGDGMPNGWEHDYGLNMIDADDRNGDLDGDSVSNKLEYELGSDPTDPASPENPPMPASSTGAGAALVVICMLSGAMMLGVAGKRTAQVRFNRR